MNSRTKILDEKISKKRLDYFLVTNPINIFYLSGFRGVSDKEREAFLLLGNSKLTLLTSKLYQSEAKVLLKEKSIDDIVIPESGGILDQLEKILPRKAVLVVEAGDIKLAEYLKLKKSGKIKLKDNVGLIENLRMIKDPRELKKIEKAVEITDRVMGKASEKIKSGLTEKDLSRCVRDDFESLGVDDLAFDTIVATGRNSSLPHYKTGKAEIKQGVILIDLGGRYQGYCGDLTRTFYKGKPDKKFINTYKIVDEVLSFVLEKIKPGVRCNDLWEMAMKKFGNNSKFFLHSLGHGVGLDIHETPYLRKNNETFLRPGMVLTIEPGLYFESWGGVRIEEYVLITDNGSRVLSKSPKAIEQIIV